MTVLGAGELPTGGVTHRGSHAVVRQRPLDMHNSIRDIKSISILLAICDNRALLFAHAQSHKNAPGKDLVIVKINKQRVRCYKRQVNISLSIQQAVSSTK